MRILLFTGKGGVGKSTVAAATAAAEPFGILVPMLPLGLLGLWGARHGVFPPRRTPDAATRDKRARRSSGRAGE